VRQDLQVILEEAIRRVLGAPQFSPGQNIDTASRGGPSYQLANAQRLRDYFEEEYGFGARLEEIDRYIAQLQQSVPRPLWERRRPEMLRKRHSQIRAGNDELETIVDWLGVAPARTPSSDPPPPSSTAVGGGSGGSATGGSSSGSVGGSVGGLPGR
jgi:hypothetical protein